MFFVRSLIYRLFFIVAIIVPTVVSLQPVTVRAATAGRYPPIPPDGQLCDDIASETTQDIPGMEQLQTKAGVAYYREMGGADFESTLSLPAGSKMRVFDADSDNATAITLTHEITSTSVFTFATGNNEFSPWVNIPEPATEIKIGRLYKHVSTLLCFKLPDVVAADVSVSIMLDTMGLDPAPEPGDDLIVSAGVPNLVAGEPFTVTVQVQNRSVFPASVLVTITHASSVGQRIIVPATSFVNLERSFVAVAGQGFVIAEAFTPNDQGVADNTFTFTYDGVNFLNTVYIPVVVR